jgi:hypothetical protein
LPLPSIHAAISGGGAVSDPGNHSHRHNHDATVSHPILGDVYTGGRDGLAEGKPNLALLQSIDRMLSLAAHMHHGLHMIQTPGSDLATDDATLPPHLSTSGVASSAILTAADALRAILLVVRQPHGDDWVPVLPVSAHYPLTRTILESAAQAVWLLHPDSRQERLTRTLRVHLSELTYARVSYRDNPELVATLDEYIAEVRSLATRQSLTISSRDDYTLREARFLSDISEAAVVSGTNPISLWRDLSGLSHPAQFQRFMVSKHIVSDHEHGQMGLVMSEAQPSIRAFNGAVLTLEMALRLLSQRGGNPEIEWARPRSGRLAFGQTADSAENP